MVKKKIVIGKEDALIVVDGQNDFIREDGALYVGGVKGELPSNSHVIDRMLALPLALPIKSFGYKTTTEDKHPENHIEHEIFGKHCVDGTAGQQYNFRLRNIYNVADENIKKGEHPALIGLSIYTSPQFPEHIANLRAKGIKRVFVVGWAYNLCVCENAITYAVQGFEEIYVIRDLTRSVPPPKCGPNNDPKSARKKMKLYGVKEIYLKDIK